MAGNETAALVVALSAQLTKFENDMKRAGEIADRGASDIEGRFNKINPSFGVGVGAFLGTLSGNLVSSAVRELEGLYDRFKKIDETAKLAAISMNEVFGFQASFKGSSFGEVDTALVTLTDLLDRAKRGEDNNLSKIFSINGVSVSSLKDGGEALLKLSDIVSRLPAIEGLQVLQKLGLPTSLLGDLQKGEGYLRDLQKSASDTAPDLQALAERAKEFDKLWKNAVDNVKAYFRDNLGDISKTLGDFIETTAKELRFIEDLRTSVRSALGLEAAQGPAGRAADSLDASAKVIREAAPRPRVYIGGQKNEKPANPFPIDDKQGGEPKENFDRTEEQITRHTAVINADAVGVAEPPNVREQLRQQANRTAQTAQPEKAAA